MTEQERQRIIKENVEWDMAVWDPTLEDNLKRYISNPANRESVYAVVEDAYVEIYGDSGRELARMPLVASEVEPDNPYLSALQREQIAKDNQMRALRVFMAIRGKQPRDDFKNGAYCPSIWDEEIPLSRRYLLAERETKLMLWVTSWLRNYGRHGDLYILDGRKDSRNQFHGTAYLARKYPNQKGLYVWEPFVNFWRLGKQT